MRRALLYLVFISAIFGLSGCYEYNEYYFIKSSGETELRLQIVLSKTNVALNVIDEYYKELAEKNKNVLELSYFDYIKKDGKTHLLFTFNFKHVEDLNLVKSERFDFLNNRDFFFERMRNGRYEFRVNVFAPSSYRPSTDYEYVFIESEKTDEFDDDNDDGQDGYEAFEEGTNEYPKGTVIEEDEFDDEDDSESTNSTEKTVLDEESTESENKSEEAYGTNTNVLAENSESNTNATKTLGFTNAQTNTVPLSEEVFKIPSMKDEEYSFSNELFKDAVYKMRVNVPSFIKYEQSSPGKYTGSVALWRLPFSPKRVAIFSLLTEGEKLKSRDYNKFRGEESVKIVSELGEISPLDYLVYKDLKEKKASLFNKDLFNVRYIIIKEKIIKDSEVHYRVELYTVSKMSSLEQFNLMGSFSIY